MMESDAISFKLLLSKRKIRQGYNIFCGAWCFCLGKVEIISFNIHAINITAKIIMSS